MILQSARMALRHLLNNRFVTGINLFGLSVGITISMLIFAYVAKERSTDWFIPEHEDIYIITNHDGGTLSQNMINLVKDQIPEAENTTYCTVGWSPQVFFTKEKDNHKISKLLVADSCFFRVFRFETVWGDASNALNTANKVVLTQSLARRIFGVENPVGKTLVYNATYLQGEPLEVGAVIKDLPQNSSWDFEAVMSLQTKYKIGWYVDNMKHWGTMNYSVFCRIPKGISSQYLNEKLLGLDLSVAPEFIRGAIRLKSFPFSESYFNFHEADILRHGNSLTQSIIQIIGVLILILACINYVNMVTAQRDRRSRSVGIVKTLGSSRSNVMELITLESALMLTSAIMVSFLLSIVLMDSINSITGSEFSLGMLLSAQYFMLLSVVFIISLLITGLIPGYIFSKHKVSLLLKNRVAAIGGNWLRNSLLVFQFIISIALISGIMLINRQNEHLRSLNTGFEKENIIYANLNADILESIGAFKNEMERISGIEDFTFSESLIIGAEQQWGRRLLNNGEDIGINFMKMSVSPNFFKFFGIGFKEGNTFSKASQANQEIIFNETFIGKYNISDIAMARLVTGDQSKGSVLGVVEDFNFNSFHIPISAAGFMCSGESDEVVYLKINGTSVDQLQQTLQSIQEVWNRLSPNFPLEHHFMDASWNALYDQDRQFQKILGFTTVISIILSCLGLIGLTFFVLERRTKEIGIRKVNGARIFEVLIMLNKDFIKWVAIAFVIATPIAWFAMHKWLQNFAYKTELSWWIFGLAGLLALGIALITVSWQSWRAARRNPVEALRYE